MKKWWAIKVITGQEYNAKKKLGDDNNDCEFFIPRQLITKFKDGQLIQKTERILPGYLLIGSESTINIYNTSSNPMRIIGEITQEEIKRLKIQEFTEKDENITQGSKIIIVEGPLAGCKGHVLEEKFKNKKVKCRLIFQGMELEIDMNGSYISTY